MALINSVFCLDVRIHKRLQMWRHNDVIGRNEYLSFTFSESTVPWVYSLQFLFKSTHYICTYEMKCEWVFFSEHSVVRLSTDTADMRSVMLDHLLGMLFLSVSTTTHCLYLTSAPAQTFLLLVLLAHRARSRFFNALYKFLTYLKWTTKATRVTVDCSASWNK